MGMTTSRKLSCYFSCYFTCCFTLIAILAGSVFVFGRDKDKEKDKE